MAENYLQDVYEDSVGTIRKFMEKIREFKMVEHRATVIEEIINKIKGSFKSSVEEVEKAAKEVIKN